MKKTKSQAQVITTVLLILLAIAGEVIISGVIHRMVRENLAGTECFKALGKISIAKDDLTYFNKTSGMVYVGIERSEGEEFNLTGLIISVGSKARSKAFKLKDGETVSRIKMYDGSTTIKIPGPIERETYVINVTGQLDEVQYVVVAPVINQKSCKEADKRDILSLD